MASSQASKIDGTVVVSISESDLSWIYRCRPLISVEQIRDVKEEVSCAIRFRSYAFDRVISYDQTLQQAMLNGDITVEGDPTKAIAFFAIACPGGVCD